MFSTLLWIQLPLRENKVELKLKILPNVWPSFFFHTNNSSSSKQTLSPSNPLSVFQKQNPQLRSPSRSCRGLTMQMRRLKAGIKQLMGHNSALNRGVCRDEEMPMGCCLRRAGACYKSFGSTENWVELILYLGQGLHNGVQQSSHPNSHLQELQYCKETHRMRQCYLCLDCSVTLHKKDLTFCETGITISWHY